MTTNTEIASHQPDGYTYRYPRPAVTVDVVIFTFQCNSLQVLLIQRKQPPYAGAWALPGGFVDMGEDLQSAALRELEEETNVVGMYLEQLYTFGEPERDPRGRTVTVAYFALLGQDQLDRIELRSADDAADAAWWTVSDLPELAFDHSRIIEYALQRLRWKLEWTALGFLLLPAEFTLSELQKVYQAVLAEKLDKRNFRRKILAADVLEETSQMREGGHRPAKLYRFSASAIELEQARRRFP